MHKMMSSSDLKRLYINKKFDILLKKTQNGGYVNQIVETSVAPCMVCKSVMYEASRFPNQGDHPETIEERKHMSLGAQRNNPGWQTNPIFSCDDLSQANHCGQANGQDFNH